MKSALSKEAVRLNCLLDGLAIGFMCDITCNTSRLWREEQEYFYFQKNKPLPVSTLPFPLIT
jgi:hypothetical protein